MGLPVAEMSLEALVSRGECINPEQKKGQLNMLTIYFVSGVRNVDRLVDDHLDSSAAGGLAAIVAAIAMNSGPSSWIKTRALPLPGVMSVRC
ncbi:hypothetical protein AEQ67_23660 [Pseudomonas sp. RIT-PI-q]|nr:hypothetical protein AEQ67_23660 [Pseudomonas sp. RIT-PI-q]